MRKSFCVLPAAVLIAVCLFLLSCPVPIDPTNVWTWVSGANTRDQSGTYGTKGLPHPDNIPGARSDSISWLDSSGNFWLFGGYGSDSAGSSGWLNDLWKYTP